MANYTEFTAQASHTIYYHFKCDHCGKDSGIQHYTFNKYASKRKSGTGKKLTPEEQEELQKRANQMLVEHVNLVRQELQEKGNYGDTEFLNKCPFCNKFQSWAGGTQKYIIWNAIFRSLGVGLISFILIYSVSMEMNSSFTSALWLALATFLVTYAVKKYKQFLIKKETKNITQKSAPEIDWNGL